jgi:hypothetical protein
MADATLHSGEHDRAEVRDLAWAIQTGEIDANGVARLDALVCANLELRREYIQVQRMLADTRLSILGQPMVIEDIAGLDPEDSLSWLLRSALQSPPSYVLLRNAFEPLADGERTTQRILQTFARMKYQAAIAISILLLMCGALGIWRYGTAGHQSGSRPWLPMFARLSAASDCQWGQDAPLIGAALPEGPIYLRTGIARLTFVDGAQLIVEGPSQFELRSAGSIYMSHGKLLAQVPRKAIGFTVETDATKIVDRGTEFVVETADRSETKFAVITGVVDLHTSSASPQRVHSGKAMVVSHRRQTKPEIETVPFDSPWVQQAAGLDELLAKRSAALVAYQAFPNGTPGNMAQFRGAIGLDFDVRRPIRISSLGVFDSLADGIAANSQMTVQLWSRDADNARNDLADDAKLKPLTELVFTPDAPGTYEFGHRFKLLKKPVDLPIGSYSIVAYGGSHENRFVDLVDGKGTLSHVVTADRAIMPVGSRSQAGALPGTFPKSMTQQRVSYVAGSFKYSPLHEHEH